MLLQEVRDSLRKCNPQLGIDVNLRHILPGHGDGLIRHTRCTMEHQGDIRLAPNLSQAIKIQLGLALVQAVSGTNCDGQGITLCALDKFCCLIGISKGSVSLRNHDVIFHAADLAQFGLYRYIVGVSNFDNFLDNGNVLFKRQLRPIDHNCCETIADALHYLGKARAVIKVQRHRNRYSLGGYLGQTSYVLYTRVLDGPLTCLDNHRGTLFLSGLNNRLDNLHIVQVKSSYGVAALPGSLQYLSARN